jgi:hypothetical protein
MAFGIGTSAIGIVGKKPAQFGSRRTKWNGTPPDGKRKDDGEVLARTGFTAPPSGAAAGHPARVQMRVDVFSRLSIAFEEGIMNGWISVVAGVALGAIPASVQGQARPTFDFTDPVQVVEALFHAAQSGDDSGLPDLCPPDGSSDGDTRDVCAMTRDAPRWDEFVGWFSTGRVTGEPTVRDDRAVVPFAFGPDGNRPEEMNLVRINGRWYLSSF